MEWISNIVKVLKIPVKVLLPATWLFSGGLIFLPEKFLKELNVFEWKKENGFIIGIILLTTSCLIVIYIIHFLKEKILDFWFRISRDKQTFKAFLDLNDTEKAIIIEMYHSPGYTMILDYTQPIIKGLVARKYIYAGEQVVSLDVYTNAIDMKFALQPFVYNALDNYKHKFDRKIDKITRKIHKTKHEKKKEKLSEYLSKCKNYYEAIYNGDF